MQTMQTNYYRIIVGSDEGTQFYYKDGRVYKDGPYLWKLLDKINSDTKGILVYTASTCRLEACNELGRSTSCED